ncbi:MAG: alpha/beta fold hydrolase [Acidobacteriota bacterium]|nr:alpha/beta fold hydrolase [Acidobacteriota bacterium]
MPVQNSSRVVTGFFIFILLACPAHGQEAAKQRISGKLIEVKISSPSLKGNLLGDPAEQPIAVYLPPGYDASPSKRYPTVYLLHGFGGSSKTWTRGSQWDIEPLLNAMMGDGKIREMIVAVLNGKNAYGGSFYTNSAVTGNWEDYVIRDVVAHMDANYRTLSRSSSRGIVGHSMGGYGAVAVGMRHPEVFSAVYALSPCCLGLEGDFKEANPVWKHVGSVTSKDQLPGEPKSLDDFYTKVYAALSAAFSPNASHAPLYSDFLYQERNGKLERNEAVAAKWQSKMPLYTVEENKQNLLSLRGLFVDYGQKEEFSHIRLATSLFSKALAERGIPHVFEVYEGGTHSSKIKERLETRVFGFFSDRLDFSAP